MALDNSAEDAFGFSSLATSAKDRLRDIKPSSYAALAEDTTKVDAVADQAGFVSREGPGIDTAYRSHRLSRPEPRCALNMRVPVSLAGAFQKFCEENRYSYPEALAEIMKRAGLEK